MNFEAVLDFWFGEWHNNVPDETQQKNWFDGGDTFDFAIKKKFTTTLLASSRGELDAWELTPRGRLAFVIVLDQFPRNIFRGTANAFLYDEKALSLARDGVEFGHHTPLRAIEKMFLYMPYQHSESLKIQKEGLALYEAIFAETSNDKEHAICKQAFEFAQQHYQLIERFGLFPHRNKVLGRQSTVQEESYLAHGGKRFGQ